MTDFYVDGKKAVRVDLERLNEELVAFKIIFDDGSKAWIGYFREET